MPISFKTQSTRNLLCAFMDNEEIYCNIVEDFGEAIDLNQILDDGELANCVYFTMRPQLKDQLQQFLKNG